MDETAIVPKSEVPSATIAKPQMAASGKKKADTSIAYPFWFGGSASSMAACVTHPLDLVKVRLQMRGADAPRSMSSTFAYIVRTDGIRGLYSGLSASLLRQLTYSTTRFGIYEELKTRMTQQNGGNTPGSLTLAGIACLSGVIGGISGNGADIVNVRMQHDSALPASQRRNYKHAIDGMLRMAYEEGGLKAWFRGVGPNSARAALMTASQLASYDTFKKAILGYTPLGDGLTTHFSASFLAGVVAATVCSPIDVIKTKVMSSAQKGQGIVGIVIETTRKEGWGWAFKGWVPSFLRLGPQTIATFIFLEAHKKMYRKTLGLGEFGTDSD